MIFASPASRDEFAGLASADDLRRYASYNSCRRTVDVLLDRLPAKQHHFPRCTSGHHFLGCSSRHHFLAPASLTSAKSDGPVSVDWLPNAPIVCPIFRVKGRDSNQDLFRANGRSPLQENCTIILNCHPVEPALISLPQYDPVWGSCSGPLHGILLL